MSSTKAYIHATIITVNKRRDVILDGAVVVQGSRIVALGKTKDVLANFKDTEHYDCTGRIIIPGLINTHAHLAQSLLRGLAEDLSLHPWLCDAIWPLEANYAENDGYIAAVLTIVEMLKSGTTCFLEAMLTHRSGIENIVRAVEETGIRGCIVSRAAQRCSQALISQYTFANGFGQGKLVKSIETNPNLNMTDARDRDVASMSIDSALAAHQTYNGAFNDRLHIWFAAGTPRGSSITAHSAIGDTAKQHNIGITMHCAEAPADLTIYRTQYDRSPLQFCRTANLTGPKTILAHVVHPEPETDYEIMHESGTTVSHNPTSNCKLGSGISPIPDMIKAGVNVALGTDGAPCNNTYDMFREMHLAGVLHSGARQTAGVINAYTVLEMGTINGARALGLDAEIGSLEVGKKADSVPKEVLRSCLLIKGQSSSASGKRHCLNGLGGTYRRASDR